MKVLPDLLFWKFTENVKLYLFCFYDNFSNFAIKWLCPIFSYIISRTLRKLRMFVVTEWITQFWTLFFFHFNPIISRSHQNNFYLPKPKLCTFRPYLRNLPKPKFLMRSYFIDFGKKWYSGYYFFDFFTTFTLEPNLS